MEIATFPTTGMDVKFGAVTLLGGVVVACYVERLTPFFCSLCNPDAVGFQFHFLGASPNAMLFIALR